MSSYADSAGNAPARAHAYLNKLAPAVSGQGGHKATFAAVCRLVEFGLNFEQAWPILTAWNQTHCQPQWTEPELRHKLADAFKRATPKQAFVQGRNRVQVCRPSLFPMRGGESPPLPALRVGTASDLAQLADLRGLSPGGIALASSRGLLRFGSFRNHPAWFITDASRRTVQARRMDGVPWARGVKALTQAGSQGKWPLGSHALSNFRTVAFCEGGPDLLAAHCFIVAEAREVDCAAVAMLGGSASIPPDALPSFEGKRVRLFPHVDATGQEAANRWAEQLAEAGATVDAFNLQGIRRTDGSPVKDLCDLAAIHADDFEAHRCLLNLLPHECDSHA